MNQGSDKPRRYRSFIYKGAKYRISSSLYDTVVDEIVILRGHIENYIAKYPLFGKSLKPLEPTDDAPSVVGDMIAGSKAAGVGPMAAVAGAIAQHAAEAAISAGAAEAIVENGGDIFLQCNRDTIVSLHTGTISIGNRVAFRIPPSVSPVSVCSSSGAMGHSMSFGSADLVTVVSENAALADAAATALCNVVSTMEDIEPALEKGMAIEGVMGVLIVVDEKIGMIGDLPELISI